MGSAVVSFVLALHHIMYTCTRIYHIPFLVRYHRPRPSSPDYRHPTHPSIVSSPLLPSGVIPGMFVSFRWFSCWKCTHPLKWSTGRTEPTIPSAGRSAAAAVSKGGWDGGSQSKKLLPVRSGGLATDPFELRECVCATESCVDPSGMVTLDLIVHNSLLSGK